MKSETKKRVGVIRGGASLEHDISLQSGSHVLQELDKEKYIPIDIYIDKEGEWHMDGVIVSPLTALKQIDIVFNACHGGYGEDGMLQELLEELVIPFNGSDAFSSRIAIDKHTAKTLLKNSDVVMPRHEIIRVHEKNVSKKLALLWQKFHHPLIIKPNLGGSSVGVYVARDFSYLERAVRSLLASGFDALVEEFVEGREVSVSVIEDFRGVDLYVPIPVYIPKKGEIFDQESKFEGAYDTDVLKHFSKKEKEMVEEMAKKVHSHLGLKHYSRSDFIVTPKKVYFLEVNTLPGLTTHSILPASLKATGVPMIEFLNHIVNLAENRYNRS